MHKDIESRSTTFPSFPPQIIRGGGKKGSACEMMGRKDTSGRVPPIATSSLDGSVNSMASPGCWGKTGVTNGVLDIVAGDSLKCEVCLEP